MGRWGEKLSRGYTAPKPGSGSAVYAPCYLAQLPESSVGDPEMMRRDTPPAPPLCPTLCKQPELTKQACWHLQKPAAGSHAQQSLFHVLEGEVV